MDLEVVLPEDLKTTVAPTFWRLIDQVLYSRQISPEVVKKALTIEPDVKHVLVTMRFKGRAEMTKKLTAYIAHLNSPERIKKAGPCFGHFMRLGQNVSIFKEPESIVKMEKLWKDGKDTFALNAMRQLRNVPSGILWFFELAETDDPDEDVLRYFVRGQFKVSPSPATSESPEEQLKANLKAAGYSEQMIDLMKFMAMARLAASSVKSVE